LSGSPENSATATARRNAADEIATKAMMSASVNFMVVGLSTMAAIKSIP
jgi:hypothetical protein